MLGSSFHNGNMVIIRSWRFSRVFLSIIIIAVLSLTVFSTSVHAELATGQEMEQVCKNWLSYISYQKGDWAGETNPEIISVDNIEVDGRLLGRCYSISPIGYVIVPVMKDLSPIKAYSLENNLDIYETDGVAALLRDVLSNRAEVFEEYYGDISAVQTDKEERLFGSSQRLLWDKYTEAEVEFRGGLAKNNKDGDVQVGPLLTTAWHQGGPFYNYCPYGDGGRCVVGCVATAAAQIQWYHQWPPAGFNGTTYIWYGDNSCGGSTPTELLSASFSDTYEYIPTIENLAEISYEMGVAYGMMYGRCGSGAYTNCAIGIFPMYYGYQNTIEEELRSEHASFQWFDMIRDEIDESRPVLYTIYRHAIVADGYAVEDYVMYQYHMNYGWGGSQNLWYTIDDLHCPWDGCSFIKESLLRYIIPDRSVMFSVDTIIGHVPCDIEFSASSDKTVQGWDWDFGDGSSSGVRSPIHTYNEAGVYDVSLTIDDGENNHSLTRTSFVYAIADSLILSDVSGNRGESVCITVYGRNTLPMELIKIPIQYNDGDLELSFDSISTIGCRTNYFESQSVPQQDPFNKRMNVVLIARANVFSTPFLEPGEGEIVKLYFTVDPQAEVGQSTNVVCEGFSSYQPVMYGNIFDLKYDYAPAQLGAAVSFAPGCGDLNEDFDVNLSDILSLVEYVYLGGNPPNPLSLGDINMDGQVNLTDILDMISYIYGDGQEPECL